MRYDKIFNSCIDTPLYNEVLDYCLIHNIDNTYIKYIYEKYNILPIKILGKVFLYRKFEINFLLNNIRYVVLFKNSITFDVITLNKENIIKIINR